MSSLYKQNDHDDDIVDGDHSRTQQYHGPLSISRWNVGAEPGRATSYSSL
jgi:hypothetical protein